MKNTIKGNEEKNSRHSQDVISKDSSLKADPIELTRDEQIMEIEDCIEESTEYYVICDQCRRVTNVEGYSDATDLYERGWRLLDNDSRMFLTCPNCVNAQARDAEITA